jgi:hypothetical protein
MKFGYGFMKHNLGIYEAIERLTQVVQAGQQEMGALSLGVMVSLEKP